MGETINNRQWRQTELKKLITRLHDGDDPDKVRADFVEMFGSVSATEISEIEKTLIEEGLPVAEIQRLCDIHASLFDGSVEKVHAESDPSLIPGHPVHTMRRENGALKQWIDHDIRPHLEDFANTGSQSVLTLLREDVSRLQGIDVHYAKKENLFFPFLEQYGVTAPPKVMWGVDNEIRDALKDLRNSLDSLDDSKSRVREMMEAVLTKIIDMISKEENILFPMMLETIQPADWQVIASGENEIGYFLIDSVASWHPYIEDIAPATPVASASPDEDKNRLAFPTGNLLPIEIQKMLDCLPVDITFVDKDDIVRYFSKGTDRIFTRTTAVIGRHVTNCHPPASVHIVEQIVSDFKSGKKDHEDFRIHMGDRYVLIRYYAVRSDTGDYLGTVEVTQDIAPIQKLEGEKRLMSDT